MVVVSCLGTFLVYHISRKDCLEGFRSGCIRPSPGVRPARGTLVPLKSVGIVAPGNVSLARQGAAGGQGAAAAARMEAGDGGGAAEGVASVIGGISASADSGAIGGGRISLCEHQYPLSGSDVGEGLGEGRVARSEYRELRWSRVRCWMACLLHCCVVPYLRTLWGNLAEHMSAKALLAVLLACGCCSSQCGSLVDARVDGVMTPCVPLLLLQNSSSQRGRQTANSTYAL